MTDWNYTTPLANTSAFVRAWLALRVEDATTPTNPALDTFEQMAVSDLALYQRTLTSGNSAVRLNSDKASDRFDLRDMAGLDLTGNNDNGALLQAAITAAVAANTTLWVPGGVVACSTSLQVPGGFSMQGMGRAMGLNASSRILFTGTQAGFICGDGVSTYEDGFSFRDMVTSRIQPEPPTSGTWTPIDAAADFVMNGGADLDLDHVLLLNATRGINVESTGVGRLNLTNVGGQVFVYGVNVELLADVFKYSGLHWWPFWSDTKPVNNFSVANCDTMYLKRCDSPQGVNLSAIAVRSGFRFGVNASGGTSKGQFSNTGIDYSTHGIWWDSTSFNSWADFNSLKLQGNNSDGTLANLDASPLRDNIRFDGHNCYMMVSNLEMAGSSGSALYMIGTNNNLTVSGILWLQDYGGATSNTEVGISVTATNSLIISESVLNTSPGAGTLYGDAGYISTPDNITFAPVVSSTGGAMALVSSSGIYTIKGDVVKVKAVVTASPGTGTGALIVGLPYSADPAGNYGLGAGQCVTNGTAVLSGLVSGSTAVFVLTTGGGFPVTASGQVFALEFEYNL